MHEMGIALQIIEIAANAIPSNLKGVKVDKVKIKIGKLTAVVPESLSFCFDIVSKDSALSGAKLVIEEIPVTAKCSNCKHSFTVKDMSFVCPECDSGAIEIISGRELDIDSLEVAEE